MLRILCLLTLLTMTGTAARADNLLSRLDDLDGDYQAMINNSHYEEAAQIADQMYLIHPSGNKARFYLLYACKKAGTPAPAWLSEPWPGNSPEDIFYRTLAADISRTDAGR